MRSSSSTRPLVFSIFSVRYTVTRFSFGSFSLAISNRRSASRCSPVLSISSSSIWRWRVRRTPRSFHDPSIESRAMAYPVTPPILPAPAGSTFERCDSPRRRGPRPATIPSACSARFSSPIAERSPSASSAPCGKCPSPRSPSSPTPIARPSTSAWPTKPVAWVPAPPRKATCASTASSMPPAATAPTPSTPATASSPKMPISPRPASRPASPSSDPPPPPSAPWAPRPPPAAPPSPPPRRAAIAAGAPVIPGTLHPVTLETLRAFADTHGFPVLLKAVAGGGGKGMRRVDRASDLESAFRDAASEAERAFRSPEIYVERLIERSRHIEIQLLGDHHGNMVHLGERECSIQRRHQKVIEECPSPLVTLHPEMRHEMGQAAIRAARAAGYYNAGTVEFLVDSDRRFYFLEMNTRLQVEHPVTELVTGLDLVRLQVEIAAGAPLPFTQDQVAWRGAAIECRVYAEDPFNDFLLYPGKLTRLTRPLGPGIRLDGCVYDGWTVPMEYDPLLAKLAVWADTRDHATARMIRALREYDVGGIHTNLAFFRQILEDPEFRAD